MKKGERIFERYNKEKGIWETIDIGDLREGDRFRIFDNGERYADLYKNTEWVCDGKHGLTDKNIRYVGTKEQLKR